MASMKKINEEFHIDTRLARLAFERAAATYDNAAVLQRQINDTMFARLEYIKTQPTLILDAGAGTGYGTRQLKTRYRQARVVELDLAHAMLMKADVPKRWWHKSSRRLAVCGNLESLPFQADCFDMVWSNLALQWVNDLDGVFKAFNRLLRANGLLMFSTFGPDTLKELRAAFSKVDSYTHVHRFIDMHDIGDALMRAGFEAPVMDVEYYTLTYDDVLSLMRELKAIGAHNVAGGRPRGLAGKTLWQRVQSQYKVQERRYPATFEVVYGHAWARGYSSKPSDEVRSVIKVHPKI